MSGNNNQDAIPDLTEYRWTYNSEGLITEYACKYLTSPEVAEYNNFEQVVVPSYFDLVYDCYDNPAALSDLIASRIVEAAAGHWHITPHGAVCDGTGESVDNNLIIAVSSQPGHSQIDRFSCQKLVPAAGECCTVVHNQMTFTPFPNYSEIDLWAYVAGRLDSGELVQPNETFQTRFIGSLIADEPPQDGTTVKGPAGSGNGNNGGSGSGVSAVQRGPQNSPGGSNNVTAVGGIILGGLMAVLVGLGIMFVRRRQQVHHDRQRRMHPDDLDSDDDYMVGVQVLSDRRNLNGMPDGLPAGVTGHEVLSPKHDASNDTDSNFRVNVTYHKSNDGNSNSSVGGHAPPPTTTATTADRSSSSNTRYRVKSLANSLSDVADNDDDDKDEYEDEVEYDSRGSSYAWDLSNSFQREIMGTHGGGSSSPTAYHNNSKSGSSSNNSSPRHQQQQQQLQRTSTPEQYPPQQQQLPQPLPNNNNNYYPHHKGPTTIEVVPPYPMDETSESEADSWAQTDASVGSLDVKLEQITAEI